MWRRREERFGLDEIRPPVVVEGKNSEVDPYFRCVPTLPSDRQAPVKEHNFRADVDATRSEIVKAPG